MQDQRTTSGAPGAGTARGPNPSGCRSERPEHAIAREAAESWTGLEGGLNHKALLDMLAVNAVAESFSLRQQHVSYLRYIFLYARSDDFAPGDWPPVVWKKISKIADDLGLKSRAVSNLEDDLARAGFIYWTDSASRRRDGWRDPDTGRIKCAYGVNLAPFAARADEIEATFRAVRREQKDCQALVYEIAAIRTRTLIRLKAALRSGAVDDSSIHELLDRAGSLPTGKSMACWRLGPLQELAAEARSIDEHATAVAQAGRDAQAAPPIDADSSEKCSLGCTLESGSNTNTNQYRDINLAAANPTAETTDNHHAAAARPGPERGNCSRSVPPQGKAPPAWLILESLPRSFAAHMPDGPTPTSLDFQTAANLTRSRLGISPSAWRDACAQLSPDAAALAIAVIAARADAGELRSPGGYLRGMVNAARKQRLDLTRSLWGMVDRAAAGEDDAESPSASSPPEPDLHSTPPEPAGVQDDPLPDEVLPDADPAPDPRAPSLQALEPIIPASIRRRLGPHSRGRRRLLHLMHAAMTECLQRLSVSGPAWRGAMDTVGLHRTTAIGIVLAAITERHPDPASAEPETVFLHLVREEAPAGLGERACPAAAAAPHGLPAFPGLCAVNLHNARALPSNASTRTEP